MTTKPIISLTDNAVMRIKKFMQKQPTAIGFRVAVEETGCSGLRYVADIIEQPIATDLKLTVQDITVYVDHDSVNFLKGTTLDCVEKDLGLWQWMFINPNVQGSCGCGESFTIKQQGE